MDRRALIVRRRGARRRSRADCAAAAAACAARAGWRESPAGSPAAAAHRRGDAPPAVTRRCVMSSCRCCACAMSSVARDLLAQRGFGDGGGDHVGGEAEIAGLQRKARVFGLRLQRLDLAAHAAERIERVRHVHRRAVQGIQIRAGLRQSELRQGGLGAFDLIIGRNARIQRATLCGRVLVRLAQGRLGGLQGGAVRECTLDQRIELRRLKQGPPLAGNVQTVDEALRLAAGKRRGCRGGRERTAGGREARCSGGRRLFEVGPDRAACQQAHGQCRHRAFSRHGSSVQHAWTSQRLVASVTFYV